MPRQRKQVENAHLLDEAPADLLSNRIRGWKIRLVFPGGMIHLVSSTQPVFIRSNTIPLHWTPVPGYGDEVGYINLDALQAVTWRYSDAIPPNSNEGPTA